MRDEVIGEKRKLHSEELSDLYCSPNIFRLSTSPRMRWAGHVALNYYATKSGCRDLPITCAHIIYSRTLSSLEDNLKMASRGRNM